MRVYKKIVKVKQMNINEGQKKAIEHLNGPMLVLAGPGSGKTFVITRRTANLIEQYGINPSNILVITFTKAAAVEMKERFVKLMGGNMPVTFGTFHSVYFTILRYAYNYNASNIVREEQRISNIRDSVQKLNLDIEDEADFINDVLSEISRVKNEGANINNYSSTSCADDVFRKIYNSYDNYLVSSNLLDFDDMLVMCYELLKERKDILSAWQKKYQYILIDEFQDINKVQYDVIKLIASPNNNIFAVGDDDQSIYGFRGAKPEIMLNFEKDFVNAKRVLLDTNYRSVETVVECAKKVIGHNKIRFDKDIIAGSKERVPVIIKEFAGQREENDYIFSKIKEYKNKGHTYSDMAILFRTNVGPRLIIQKLMEYNIPFKTKDSIPNIFEHFIAKNIISYIKIALGDNSRYEFFQIMNKPKRYISRDSIKGETVNFDELCYLYRDKAWLVERINKLVYDLRMLRKMSPFAGVNYIRHAIGYEDYLKEYAEYRRMKFEDLLETLDEIMETAREFRTYDEWFNHMENYSKELQRQAKKQLENIDGISLATFHSSKGLEYKDVFIIDANEGITPHNKALLDDDIEEERRMFYVALTRAKENLCVCYVNERYNKKLVPSRFVGEMLISSEDLSEGAKIEHIKYGKGVVRKTVDNKVYIYFENSRKELVMDREFLITNRIIKVIK